MNNKCGCGCDNGCQGSCCQAGSAFVPVNSNWDFNMDGCQQDSGCQPGSGCRRQRQNRCNTCEAENTCKRSRQADCAERSTCQKNTCTGRADCTCEKCMRRREADCNTCGNAYTTCQKNACTGRADCTCDKCMRRREADCNTCGNAYTTCQKNVCTGRADCTCENCSRRRREAEYNNCGKQKNKADNRGVGIMWAKAQEIDEVYDCGRALKAGTLYPELHKPMNGYCPCDEDCGDKCQQIAFAMWELRLYLNTHPCDQEALAMLRKLQTACCEPNYATTFLEDVCCTDGTRNPAWRWTRDPWPWEYEANCGC